EGCSVRSALIQGFEQCIFINDPAAGNIDDLEFRCSHLEEVFTYNPFRLRGKWSMDGKKIRLGSNFIHFHLLDLRFLGLIVGQIRVEGNDSHAEDLRTFGYNEPAFTNTDDKNRIAVNCTRLVS